MEIINTFKQRIAKISSKVFAILCLYVHYTSHNWKKPVQVCFAAKYRSGLFVLLLYSFVRYLMLISQVKSDLLHFIWTTSFLYHRQDFYSTWLYGFCGTYLFSVLCCAVLLCLSSVFCVHCRLSFRFSLMFTLKCVGVCHTVHFVTFWKCVYND